MNFKYLLCFALFPTFLFAQEIQWICHSVQNDESCNGYIITDKGKVLVSQDFDSYMVQMTSIKYYSTKLIGVITGCGTGCTSANFVDLHSGKVSSDFQQVVAVNPSKNYVAYVGADTVTVQPIFQNNPAFIITKAFKPDPNLFMNIDEAKFLSNGDFYLSYETINPNDSGELTIKIDYSNSELSNS